MLVRISSTLATVIVMNKQRGYNAKRTKVSVQKIEALSESPFPQTQVTLQNVWSVGYKAGWASV